MIVEVVVSAASGALLSWLIAHVYYKRSAAEVPGWAKPLLERFPVARPTPDQLIDFFHEALEEGELAPEPTLGYVACPQCKAPSSELVSTRQTDHQHDDDYHVVTCRRCGWTDGTAV